ncbi:hypothetical protein NKR23_g8620 [Pleurostoma richardsiae]|uniref:Uncharacterized protein n=1 Tax=Pleurostoma richardsiae TaxID=41990 RepID=A0AA38RI46_9PEZI|nr:hypothetical protein NKR23_g8620 [Pleurostoma richardsiae]
MSREAYQVPTGQTNNFGGVQKFTDDFSRGEGPAMSYLCGDCGEKQSLKKSEPIRCKECGCRVLYKERTKRMVQFEAR